MAAKKLIKLGNSLAVVLNKPILDMLKVGSRTLVEVSSERGRIIVTPVKGAKGRSKTRRK